MATDKRRRYKHRQVETLEKRKGEIFHVDDTYSILRGQHELWKNFDTEKHSYNELSDDIKALKSFRITIIIETN